MAEQSVFAKLQGQWSGKNQLWVMPGDPVRESATRATVTMGARGAVAVISYSWDYEGQPQEGVLMVRPESSGDAVQITWVSPKATSTEPSA